MPSDTHVQMTRERFVELREQMRAGDKGAGNSLATWLRPVALAVCHQRLDEPWRTNDDQDVAQDSVVKAMRPGGSVDHYQPDRSSPLTYFMMVFRADVISWMRTQKTQKNKPNRRTLGEATVDLPSRCASLIEELEREELIAEVDREFSMLPIEDRELVFCKRSGIKYTDIAESLGITEEAARGRFLRITHRVRAKLQDRGLI
ncbi:MAG: sigma-70 family RNA polymerase sigma factor [Gemmataceae bacterium]|nr:sigma-70 family RNA polymerase sigma factor [Gemmataceae bacterium]